MKAAGGYYRRQVKRLALLLAIIIGIASFPACSAASGYKLYKGNTEGVMFSFEYPASWSLGFNNQGWDRLLPRKFIEMDFHTESQTLLTDPDILIGSWRQGDDKFIDDFIYEYRNAHALIQDKIDFNYRYHFLGTDTGPSNPILSALTDSGRDENTYDIDEKVVEGKTQYFYRAKLTDMTDGTTKAGGADWEWISFSAIENYREGSPHPPDFHSTFRKYLATTYNGRVFEISYKLNTDVDDPEDFAPGIERLLATFRFLE
jgi:hypothetical protein